MSYTIYGKSGCQPCANAKALLESKGLEYVYIDVLKLDPEDSFWDNRFKTVPQVYFEDTHIGGFDKLQEYLQGE